MHLFTRLMGLFWLFAEGLIMVWVRGGLVYLETGRSRFRVSRLLKTPTSPGPRFPGWGMALLCALFLAGFGIYHGYLHLLVGRSALSGQAIVNILRFYIKTCGVFWILIEWIVALIGVKTYLVLKGGPHAPVTG